MVPAGIVTPLVSVSRTELPRSLNMKSEPNHRKLRAKGSQVHSRRHHSRHRQYCRGRAQQALRHRPL